MKERSYVLTVATDGPERKVELLHKNIRQHGTIYNTLAEVCEIHGEIETVAIPTSMP